jgi:hypothetical protein
MRFATFVARKRRPFMGIAAILLIFGGFGLMNQRTDYGMTSYLPGDMESAKGGSLPKMMDDLVSALDQVAGGLGSGVDEMRKGEEFMQAMKAAADRATRASSVCLMAPMGA